MADPGAQTQKLVQARELMREGKLEEAHLVLCSYLLSAPADTDALDIFAKVLTEAGREEAGEKMSVLSGLIKSTTAGGGMPFGDKEMVKPLFEAAYALMDVRQFGLAASWLERCLALAPDEPVVRYELAFALMAQKKFQDAIPHFQQVTQELNDFDSHLNLSVCSTLARDLKQAKSSLERVALLASDEEEKKELAHRRTVLKRMEDLGNRGGLNERDWLYALYGAILLHPNEKLELGDSPDAIRSIASTLLILVGVLKGLSTDFETIEFYNPLSKPLARMLAELMDLPLDSYKGPTRPDKALLVMAWATDIIGPHRAFVDISDRRSLFAYGLPLDEPLPVLPEIIGGLSEHVPLPWDEETRTTTVEEIIFKIMEKARHLETDVDILKQTQTAVEYYHLKRELLLLANWQRFPERPEYTAEVPG